jgi:hypothetical protein
MKNGVHLLNSSNSLSLLKILFISFFCLKRFFQRMGTFVFYFAICLLALIVRGYYRVPQTCIYHEKIEKEEHASKSIIIDRPECKCHYTNFLWHNSLFDDDDDNNHTMFNVSIGNISNIHRHFEPTALVRNKDF